MLLNDKRVLANTRQLRSDISMLQTMQKNDRANVRATRDKVDALAAALGYEFVRKGTPGIDEITIALKKK